MKNSRLKDELTLLLVKILSNTSRFKYKNPKGHWSVIRFVMGDNDIIFVAEKMQDRCRCGFTVLGGKCILWAKMQRVGVGVFFLNFNLTK